MDKFTSQQGDESVGDGHSHPFFFFSHENVGDEKNDVDHLEKEITPLFEELKSAVTFEFVCSRVLKSLLSRWTMSPNESIRQCNAKGLTGFL